MSFAAHSSRAGIGAKAFGIIVVLFVWLWSLLASGKWPELYTFWLTMPGVEDQSLLKVPVHLDDDVMIVMRSGEMLLGRGVPSFNRFDLAQPSTSYLLPYVAALLLWVLPPNIATLSLGFLGAVAVALTLALIVWVARWVVAGVTLAVLLALTTTNVLYSLQGWDHLFQGVLLAAAVGLSFTADGAYSNRRLILVATLLALGCAMRLDGIPMALAIGVAAALTGRDKWRIAVRLGMVFGVLISSMFVANYLFFGHLTPTTSRLKVGSAPSLEYSIDYLADNAITTYSAGTLLVLLVGYSLIQLNVLGSRYMLPLCAGALATAASAAFNSDVFPGLRMLWMPAAVMAVAVAARQPALFTLRPVQTANGKSEVSLPYGAKVGTLLLMTVVIASLLWNLVYLRGVAAAERAFVGQEWTESRTAQNYAIAQWIEENLDPADGAIAVYFAGVSFHLPRFEVADLLGKGDEAIASGPKRVGPPGHNKWNFESTLEKWNPQAIFTLENTNPALSENYAYSQAVIAMPNAQWVVDHEMTVDPGIREAYQWCEVVSVEGSEPLGLLLRNDIAADSRAPCQALWPPPGTR